MIGRWSERAPGERRHDGLIAVARVDQLLHLAIHNISLGEIIEHCDLAGINSLGQQCERAGHQLLIVGCNGLFKYYQLAVLGFERALKPARLIVGAQLGCGLAGTGGAGALTG